jgi:signal transduction histidine kinase
MVNCRIFDELQRDLAEYEQMDKALQYRTNILATLHQVMLDLVSLHETDDILRTLLARMGVLFDASNISFDLVQNNDGLVRYTVTTGQLLKKGAAVPKGEAESLSWEVIESGQFLVLEDYSTSRDRGSHTDEHPTHAIIVIPIRQRERVIGVINISRSEANKPFSDTDIYAARQLALMTALVLDNSQLYAQLNSDLTERVQSEVRLRELQTQVIDERQRMARDLHDSVNQSINSLVLFSETLVSTLDKNNVERARQISGRIQESARQALKETRLLLYQTQTPVEGRDVDLIEELNARLANVELRAGIRAQLILEGSLEHCPAAWHENLFWITIEALNNSLKHAQARRVQINIRSFPKYVELEVKDNGRGFDTARPNAGGYGLRTMRERTDLLGGELTLTSNPAKGTSVLLRVEIKE